MASVQFDKEALEKIADTSLARKTGARGLRAIMENVMMDTMYHVPSNDRIKTCRITKEAVEGTGEPVYNSGPWRQKVHNVNWGRG